MFEQASKKRWRDKIETTHDHRLSLSNVLDSAKNRLIDVTPEPKKITKIEKIGE